MQNPRFFVLKIGGFAQYKYAFFEAVDGARYSATPPSCPACARPIGRLPWLAPHEVQLKQPRRVGDFVSGAGGSAFLASERFVEAWQDSTLSGIDRLLDITVVRMGTTASARSLPRPHLHGVTPVHSMTRVDYTKMGVQWSVHPDRAYCRTCGPGGGGLGGIARSWQRIMVDPQSWTGDDMFFAINFPGTILLSESAAAFIEHHRFSNAQLIPADDYAYAFGA